VFVVQSVLGDGIASIFTQKIKKTCGALAVVVVAVMVDLKVVVAVMVDLKEVVVVAVMVDLKVIVVVVAVMVAVMVDFKVVVVVVAVMVAVMVAVVVDFKVEETVKLVGADQSTHASR